MPNHQKHDQILDGLQNLLQTKNIQSISVSEIAQAAGVGKGSIYYYFPSKDAILAALVKRNYEKPLETAKLLAKQSETSPFVRMAMIFLACRNSSNEFRTGAESPADLDSPETAMLHQKYLQHIITEMKPVLTEIIQQGIDSGEIRFDYPAALAEIVLIVLSVKLDNRIAPASTEEIEDTIRGLISLLEKGTENPAGSLNFLMTL